MKSFQEEAEKSVQTLKKSEDLFLDLVAQQEKLDQKQGLLSDSLKQHEIGSQHFKKECEALVAELNLLNRRIQSNELKAEIEQRRQTLVPWNRARTMRLTSDYGRAIYQQTLDSSTDIEAGGRTIDVVVPLTAMKLEALYWSRHQELYNRHGEVRSDPSTLTFAPRLSRRCRISSWPLHAAWVRSDG